MVTDFERRRVMIGGDFATAAADVLDDERLTVRAAEPSDRDRAVGLLQDTLEGDPPQAAGWEWKFLGAPAAEGRLRYLLAEAGEEIAGQYALVPVRMQQEDKEVLGLLSPQTATDPADDERRLLIKLARQLYGEVAADCPFVFGFMDTGFGEVAYEQLEWVNVRPTPLLVRPVAGLASVAAGWRPWAAPLGAAGELALRGLGAANRGLARLGPGRRERRVEPLDGFGPWADRLWGGLAPVLGIAVIRDAAFLNWRFVDAPFEYRRHALVGPDGPEGFAVVGSLQRRGLELDMLMELMVRPDDAAGARLLLDRVLREATERRVAAIATVATPRHPHMARLRQAGFVGLPRRAYRGLTFGVRALNTYARANKLYYIDRWHLSGADLDFV